MAHVVVEILWTRVETDGLRVAGEVRGYEGGRGRTVDWETVVAWGSTPAAFNAACLDAAKDAANAGSLTVGPLDSRLLLGSPGTA